MGFTEIFGGSTIYPSDTTYLQLSIAANISLAWPIEQQIGGDRIVSDIMDINATVPGLSVALSDARQVTTGFTALFNNVGANTVTIRDSDGATIVSLLPGTAWQIYLRDNSTAAGLWRTFQYGASVSVAAAAALAGAGLKAITTTLNIAYPVVGIGATPTAVTAGDRAQFLNWTGGVGAFSLPDPATVGNDWNVIIRNSGSGNLTLTPATGSIDGIASKVLAPGASCLAVCSGTEYFTLSGGGGSTGGSGFSYVAIDVSGAGDYVLSGVELDKVGYEFTGTLTGNRNIIVPGTTQEYWVTNGTTGAFDLTIKTATQVTGVQVLPANRKILYCNGSDVVPGESTSISYPVAVALGGTGATNSADARTNLVVPTRTGGDASGTWNINILGNAGTATNGVTTSNIGALAPSLTGSGATGTWGINISGNAATATNATNAANASFASNSHAVDGYHADTAASASTVAARNGSGYLYSVYFNQSSPPENPTIGNVIVESGGDGFLRKMSKGNFYAQAPYPGVMPGVTIAADPGGTPAGSPGQIFYYY